MIQLDRTESRTNDQFLRILIMDLGINLGINIGLRPGFCG